MHRVVNLKRNKGQKEAKMNAYDDNPFFFFVDNAHPRFSMGAYPDMGKIIELADTGCDARAPSSSTGRKSNQNRPYSAKNLYSDVSSFRDVFDGKEELRNVQFNEILDKRAKRATVRDRTVPRDPRRSRTTEKDVNEKVDQWERNIADLQNTILRNQMNSQKDSPMGNTLDSDFMANQSGMYFDSNSKNAQIRRDIDRKSKKEDINDKREEASKGKRIGSGTAPTRIDRREQENLRKNNNEESKSNHGERKRSIDRGVDKDSLSDISDTSINVKRNTHENRENVPRKENFMAVQRPKGALNENAQIREGFRKKENRSKTHFNDDVEADKDDSREMRASSPRNSSRESKYRVVPQTRPISKSADFDKAKHRANMAKRYANKTWMKAKQETSTSSKTEDDDSPKDSNVKKIDHTKKNEDSRGKAISRSAGASIRTRDTAPMEKFESKKVDVSCSFDDNADTPMRATKNFEERSLTNRTRTTGVSVSKSFRQEAASGQSRSTETRSKSQGGSIQRKDLEKLSAIFLSSTLKRVGKSGFAKNKFNQLDMTERSKFDNMRMDDIEDESDTSRIRPSISNLSKLPSKTEKWVKSKIPVAISRLKKELEETHDSEDRDFDNYRSRDPSMKSRTKSTMWDNERIPNERIDESTSTGIIPPDKTDRLRHRNQEKDEIRSRFDEWCKKLEETRRRERDVESKVLQMAKAQKDEMKKEFEKRGLRESTKRPKGESMDVTAGKIFEKQSSGKKSRCTSSYNDSRDVIDGNHPEKDHKESHPKPYSLRSTMYARYFPTTL